MCPTNHHSILSLFLFALILIISIGCARGDVNPITPDITVPSPPTSNRYLWGYWDISVDPENLQATVVPARTADFHLNAVKLLEVWPCTDCLSISNIHIIEPHKLSIDVTLRHPYENNLNLTAFDVRGIMFTNADEYYWWLDSFSWGTLTPRLVNADGYTRVFHPGSYSQLPDVFKYYPGTRSNGDDFNSVINPFVAYARDAPRRMFLPGSHETRTMLIEFPSMPFEFGYAVDACWAPPGKQVVDPAIDFPPEANCNEPYQLNVSVSEGLDEWDGSKAEVQIEVLDHRGADTVENCNIQAVDLDIAYLSATSVVNDDGNVVFTGEIRNALAAPAGIYPLVVRVTCTIKDPRVYAFYAHQVIPIEVLPIQQHPPIAAGDAYPKLRTVGDEIEFFDDGSYDPDGGSITLREWDFENDGTWDAEGETVFHAYNTPGDYEAMLRVTDDDGLSTILDEPISITVKTGIGWVRTWPAQFARDVAADSDGNVYVVGYWTGAPRDFDPGPGEDIHSELGGFTAFLMKFDSTGIYQWGRTWGVIGSYYDAVLANRVAVDSNHDIYVAGNFAGNCDFDPGPGEDIHESSARTSDGYVSKFTADGEYRWVRSLGREGDDSLAAVSSDSDGNIYIGGRFSLKIDLDPGPGEDIHVCNGEADAFLVKIHPDGVYEWGRTWGSNIQDSNDNDDTVFGVSAESAGYVFAAGRFAGACDFDPGPGEDIHGSNDDLQNSGDAFLSAFDSDGNYIWARTWGGSLRDSATAVAVAFDGSVFTTGYFEGTADLNPDPGIDRHNMGNDRGYFLSRFNADGDFLWAGSWRAPRTLDTSWVGSNLATDGTGGVFMTGVYDWITDFDPGSGVEERKPPFGYGNDMFLSKFNTDGEFQWVNVWGGGGTDDFDQAQSVACGPGGEPYVTGTHDGTCDFDPGPGLDERSVTTFEAFLLKFAPDGSY